MASADAGFLLDALLVRAREPAPVVSDVAAFWASHHARTDPTFTTLDTAVLGGALADRLGYAFVAGYQAALRRLVPNLPDAALVSLCATEVGGAHPRAIATRLTATGDGGLRLEGAKQWASCAGEAPELLIIATTGLDEHGRNRLRAVRVPADRAGVVVEAMPPTAFVPEVPHGRVRLDAVAVEPNELLDGDGYVELLKPFRTVEDLHVTAAALGHLVRVGLGAGWTDGPLEALLAAIAGARSLALASPDAAGVHLAVAGLLAQVARLLDGLEPEWARVEDATRARWRRDAPLLGSAGTVRDKRRTAAWRRVRS